MKIQDGLEWQMQQKEGRDCEGPTGGDNLSAEQQLLYQ